MKKAWLVLSLILSSLVLVSCNSNDPKKISLESDDDKTFYAMGYMLGGRLLRAAQVVVSSGKPAQEALQSSDIEG